MMSSKQKDTFLYVNMNDRLFSLNLREFNERPSSKPELELVQVSNHPTDHDRGIRIKECMTVFNSNLYMMTQTKRGYDNFDLDVYSIDPTDPADRKSIRLCDKPRLFGGNSVELFTLEEKIYVLGEPSYRYYDNHEEEPQLFWVFDPFYEVWKQLPHPPLYNPDTFSVDYNVSFGHKVFVSSDQRYVFDAHQERWEKSQWREDREYDDKFSAVVEFDDGFIIAVPHERYEQKKSLELVAYKLDVEGFPQRHQVLHELKGMFPYRPLLNNPQALLGKCDDDDNLMWLVYSGKDNVQNTCIGVAVYRVSMSYDHAGKEVFSIHFEAADYLDSKSLEVQGADEVHSAAAMCHDNLKTNRKDWFLYLNVGDRLCRLNISEFCKRRSSFVMPKTFELVRDFHPEGRLSTIPSRMNHIIVGSKQYFVGGQRLDGRIHCDEQGRYFPMPNLDIYELSYNSETEEGPSITPCQCEDSIPRLIDPRTKTIPITMTLDNKIYVLAKRPYLGDAEELNIHDQPPLFKVFDPLNQSWKHLPHPPCYDMSYRDAEPYVCNYFSWGHKLVIRTEAKKEKTNRGTYIFDTQKERWEDATNMSAILDEGFRVVAEFQGFLIGMPYERQELVAYHLDPDGIPTVSNVLHELQGIFGSCSLVSDCFLGKVDEERMWLVYSAQDSLKLWHARVAVFRVVISNDWDGIEFFSAYLEAAEFFQFDRFIASAFSYAQ